jgi:hypothetical protein
MGGGADPESRLAAPRRIEEAAVDRIGVAR